MVSDAIEPGLASIPLAFDEFYRQCWDRMVRTATLMVGRPAVAEELVQEAFLKVQPRYAALDAPAAYLRTVVLNRCRNHLRRTSLERARTPAPALEVHDPELDATWQELQRLTPRKRAAIVLRFYEDLPIEQVASALGCRPGTASSLIHRALDDLREVLS
jgi:RNA polymerase sigma factor (sigma-70 family)